MDSPALPFSLHEELGSGTSGKVRRALLKSPWQGLAKGQSIAVKFLSAEAARDPLLRRAFEREAQVLMGQKSPGLLSGYATGEGQEGPWLAMELVQGPELAAELRRTGPFPEQEVRAMASRLAGALAALEARGYIHGDLSLKNVRLDGDGQAVLIDLGFVRPLDADAEERARVGGSLAYLSPEEARGKTGNAASEVFSLGLLLFELATGEHPFLATGATPGSEECLRRLASAGFQAPSLLVATLSPFFDLALAEMLDPDPRRRPTAAEARRRFREQEDSAWWRSMQDLDGTGQSARHTSGDLPFVGRETSLASLRAATHATLSGTDQAPASGCVVELVGASGGGQSRLVLEFAHLARRRPGPPLFLNGHCLEFEGARPCEPILALARRYLGLASHKAAGPREDALLAELLTPDERDTLMTALDPAFAGSFPLPVPHCLGQFLVALSGRAPLVLFLDDISWADGGTLDVLAALIEALPGLALLLILGRCPEARTHHPKSLARLLQRARKVNSYSCLELEPLDQSDLDELVDQLFSAATARRRLAQVLWKRSRGNPGLISEILRQAHERGLTTGQPGALTLTVHPGDLPLPGSLGDEIAANYRRLEPLERLWLRRLSVAGGLIQSAFLARAWPREDSALLEQTLEHLTRAGWLSPLADRYRFRRPALRAAVYSTLSHDRRRSLHHEVANALAPAAGNELTLAAALQRAFHLHAAGASAELLRVLRPLLEELLKRGQHRRVSTLAVWGVEALEELKSSSAKSARHPSLAVGFLLAGAHAADLLGQRQRQRSFLDQLAELDLDPATAPEKIGEVYLLHARFSISTGQYGPARGMLRAAAEAFERAGARSLESDAWRRLAAIHGHVGELVAARRVGKRALALAADDYSRAQAELALGVVELLEDRIEASLHRADRCLILLRRVPGFVAAAARARANSLRARIYRGAGRPRRALVSAQRALRLAQQSGDLRLEIELRARLGCHLLDIDRVDAATSTLREALLSATEIEDRRGEAIAALFLGLLLAEQDDPAADRELARSTLLARELGLHRVRAVGLALSARRQCTGDAPRALAAATVALELLEQYGAELIDRVVILGTAAVILERQGQSTRAKEMVRALRKRMARENAAIGSALLKRRQRLATTRLLEAALTLDGPVYRRVRLEWT
jgi:tetratricopeptide (TPR) repeat protein